MSTRFIILDEQENLIPVGEIDSYGRFHIDSLFHHRHNAESYAKVLLQRGAFRVAIDGVVVHRSRLAKEMDGDWI